MSSPASDRPAPKILDLEVKDARIIFMPIWEDLEAEIGREELRFPKEIILLGGAPGSGKGTQTQFICEARDLTCPPIVMSEMLTTPEMEKIKAQGGMVGDKEVLTVLLRKLLEPTYRDGVVLDGFPRTPVQVEFLKLLVDKINELHNLFANTNLAIYFRRPTIHAMVLFVSESTSIARQLGRGREIAEHNRKVAETGIGAPIELRATDLSEDLVRRRYQVFKEQTWTALTSLRQLYHYHFVNAEGPVADVQANILKELKYQSSLELDPRTFERVRALPLAEELVVHARQELVKRLDGYELEHTQLLSQIVELVATKCMPIIERHALSGRAHVNSEDPIFNEPLAIPMLIDLFSERGYHALVDKTIQLIPERVDLTTGEIKTRTKAVYRIQIYFEASKIRRG
ncbi:MAG TPA: nucleoside monophosphate kinase [Vicinamibacterales bacterium]|jgi:adenylate kinase|nr:nucleoside monophosphate kinase [Vicinamibacterales bacterium]